MHTLAKKQSKTSLSYAISENESFIFAIWQRVVWQLLKDQADNYSSCLDNHSLSTLQFWPENLKLSSIWAHEEGT